MSHTFIADGPIAGGRITIFRDPRVDRPCALGLDFAYGIQGGDFDAGVMLDSEYEQVLTVHGHWGEGFADVLWPILQWYQPFVVGERQVGLPTLRKLYDRGYGWMYFNRDESKKGKPARDCLGHHAHAADGITPRLRSLIAPRNGDGTLGDSIIKVRDTVLHSELCKYGFQPRSANVPIEGARDTQYVMSAPPGEHDDLVKACGYAAAGVEWLPAYEKPREQLPADSIGAFLGYDDEDEKPRSRWARR
jgi:hypothetical protein